MVLADQVAGFLLLHASRPLSFPLTFGRDVAGCGGSSVWNMIPNAIATLDEANCQSTVAPWQAHSLKLLILVSVDIALIGWRFCSSQRPSAGAAAATHVQPYVGFTPSETVDDL